MLVILAVLGGVLASCTPGETESAHLQPPVSEAAGSQSAVLDESDGASGSVAGAGNLAPLPESINFEDIAIEGSLAAVDVIMILSDVKVETPVVVETRPHLALQTFSGTIERVLFTADVSVDSVVWGGPPYPRPSQGDSFTAYAEAKRTSSDSLPESDAALLVDNRIEPRLVVAAQYINQDHLPDKYPAEWVALVALALPDGSIQFGPETDVSFAGVLPAVRAAAAVLGASDVDDTDTLVSWVEELTAHRKAGSGGTVPAPETAGPHVAAWRSMVAASSADTAALWQSADPKIRALDPELTPTAVFEQLEELPLFVDIPEEAASALDGFDLVVRTNTGVTHLAEVKTGDHPGQLFAMPGELVEVLLTNDFRSGTGTVVGALSYEQWQSAAGVLVEIRPSLVSMLDDRPSGPGYSVATALDEAALAAKIAEHAEEHPGELAPSTGVDE